MKENQMKKATAVALCALAALCASGAMKWKNFDDKSHLSGPKLTEDDLLGKAVLLYYWDAADEASVKYLPEVEKVWNSFKTKKFAVIGTYGGAKDEAKIKAAVEKGKVTFPVYYKFDMDPPPTHWKTPYFCVINHRGTVVYSGAGMKDATQKSVEAMTAIGMPISLCGDVTFKKFKSLEKQLALGKNVSSIVKNLEKQLKSKDSNVVAEAQEIISAIDSAKDDVKEDIALYREADPAEAIKLINLFLKTWPKDDSAKEYKEAIPELKKTAAERAKAAKEKAKEK
jgi:hypothetical protein